MKYYKLLLIIFLIITAQTGIAEELHRTGLLYRDPALNPDLTKITYIPLQGKSLLVSIDLSSQMPSVGNQGAEGSCVAWAMGYYHKTHTEWREQGWNVSLAQNQFSPAFLYNLINGGADAGAYFDDAMKCLVDLGCGNLALCPYTAGSYTNWPSEDAFVWALPYRGAGQYYIDCSNDAGLTLIKTQLNNGYTVVLGINVYGNFDNIGDYNNTYCVSQRTGSNRGGHGVTIVGYDDNMSTADGAGAFKLVNSWGPNWGAAGYFWMSYVAVKNSYLSYRQVYYVTDKIGYNPTIRVRTKLTHNARTRIGLQFGYGPTTSPRATKNFFNWYMGTQTNRAYPNNNLVFDMTDNASSLGADSAMFIRCIDNTNDGLSGTINYFSSEIVGSVSQASTETPVTIPNYNTAVYARVSLKQGVYINPPTPVSPTNGSSVTVLRPTLQVQSVTGATQYQFRVYQNSSLITSAYTSTNTWTVGVDLQSGLTYQWDCAVQTANGWSSFFSPRWTFSVNVATPPVAPTPLSPANGSSQNSLKPSLKVQSMTGVTQYHFRLYRSGTLAMEKYQTSNTWNINTNLQRSSTYLWDCQVQNSVGWGPYFSPQWSFGTRAKAGEEPEGIPNKNSFSND